VKYTKGVTSF